MSLRPQPALTSAFPIVSCFPGRANAAIIKAVQSDVFIAEWQQFRRVAGRGLHEPVPAAAAPSGPARPARADRRPVS